MGSLLFLYSDRTLLLGTRTAHPQLPPVLSRRPSARNTLLLGLSLYHSLLTRQYTLVNLLPWPSLVSSRCLRLRKTYTSRNLTGTRRGSPRRSLVPLLYTRTRVPHTMHHRVLHPQPFLGGVHSFRLFTSVCRHIRFTEFTCRNCICTFLPRWCSLGLFWWLWLRDTFIAHHS